MLIRSDSSPRQGLLTASLRFGLRPALRASESAPGGFVPGSTDVHVLWIPANPRIKYGAGYAGMT